MAQPRVRPTAALDAASPQAPCQAKGIEVSARPKPDPLADRLRDIQSITDAELSRLDDQDLLAELLERTKDILSADTAAVLLLDWSSGQLIATAAAGLEEEVRQGVRIPLGRGFAGRIAAEHKPVVLDRVDHSTVLNPILLARGIRSLMGVPLVAGGRVIGVLHVGSLTARTFTDQDVELLQMAADRAAAAVHSMMARADRVAAAALQRSLIPSAPSAVAGAEIAARFIAGQGGVGGDWYDVFTLPSGELGLVIGDVAGSGLQAAVVMGRLRSALRAYTLETTDPAEVLTRLDRKIQHFEPGALATVLYAVIEPGLSRARISSAGHIPPVVAVPGRAAELADIPPDLMIGVAQGARRHVTVVELPPGALLCLCTDGLIERKEYPLDDGLARLCKSVTTQSAEAVCGAVMAALVGKEPVRDDIALLVFRRLSAAPLHP
jgi:sigma-B regulation protein RsbU (phosphoserine phosphatase)